MGPMRVSIFSIQKLTLRMWLANKSENNVYERIRGSLSIRNKESRCQSRERQYQDSSWRRIYDDLRVFKAI